jgi:hypothetical protein
MPTKVRFAGVNHTQLPQLVSDGIALKGLPQTAGYPDGYGDLASAVNGLIDAVEVPNLKSLITDNQAIQRAVTFYVDGTGDQTVWGYSPTVSRTTHNGIDIISPDALAAWDGTIPNISTLLNWSGAGSGCFIRVSKADAAGAGALKQSAGTTSSRVVLQKLVDGSTPIDQSNVGLTRYVVDAPITFKSESAVVGRNYNFSGTLIKPSGDFCAIEPLSIGTPYTRFTLKDVMLECDSNTSAYAVNFTNLFLAEIDNVWIRNGFKGVNIVGCDSITFNSLKVMETQRAEAVTIGDSSRSIRFNNCNFETSVAFPLVGGNVTLNGSAQTVTQAEFFGCQWERSKLEVTSGKADVFGGKFTDAAIRFMGGSQDCSFYGTCYGTTAYHDVGSNNLANNIRCTNADVDRLAWPKIIDPSATALAAPVVGAINDEMIVLASVANKTTTAITTGLVELKDGSTTIDSYSSISLPASLNPVGSSARQVKTFMLLGKATTAAPTVAISSGLKFASLAGGKNLLANGLFISNTTGWLNVSAPLTWNAGRADVAPSSANWGIYQAINTICKNGKNYLAVAKYSGVASLSLGNAWDGSAGSRSVIDAGIQGYFADGDTLAMVAFNYQRGITANLSLGRLGNTAPISVDFFVLIEI